MKNGAPINVVSNPNGISVVVNDLARSSTSNKKNAPTIILAGKRIL